MMIKSQLIEKMIGHFIHLPDKDVNLAINKIIKSMSHTLAQGGRIEIRGFGSFALRFHRSRSAHNPKTGEKLITEPKYVVHFKPGKEMHNRVNHSRHLPLEADQIV